MLIAILSGAVCLIISIILFTPMFRHFTILRPVALFFFFFGIWIFVEYLITHIYPGTEAMQWIHYAGIIIFGGYLIICLVYNRPRRETLSKSRKRNRTKSRHHIDINNRPDD